LVKRCSPSWSAPSEDSVSPRARARDGRKSTPNPERTGRRARGGCLNLKTGVGRDEREIKMRREKKEIHFLLV